VESERHQIIAFTIGPIFPMRDANTTLTAVQPSQMGIRIEDCCPRALAYWIPARRQEQPGQPPSSRTRVASRRFSSGRYRSAVMTFAETAALWFQRKKRNAPDQRSLRTALAGAVEPHYACGSLQVRVLAVDLQRESRSEVNLGAFHFISPGRCRLWHSLRTFLTKPSSCH